MLNRLNEMETGFYIENQCFGEDPNTPIDYLYMTLHVLGKIPFTGGTSQAL